MNIKKDVELANALGVAQNTISAWKKRNSMNYDLLFSTCEAYNIDLNWIVYGSYHEMRPPSKDLFDMDTIDFDKLEHRALDFLNMIQTMPWPVETKRKILESYVRIVYDELNLRKGSRKKS